MVALSMSHRYSTGTLAAYGTSAHFDPKRTTRPCSWITAQVEIGGKVVEAVVENHHLQAFNTAANEMGLGCRILMEHDGTWDEWTIHHIGDSEAWAALAEPRIKPVRHAYEIAEETAAALPLAA